MAGLREFDPFDSTNRTLLQIAGGDREEAKLLRRALDRGMTDGRGSSLDNLALANFRRSIFGTSISTRGSSFRDYHRMSTDEVRLNFRRLAFAGPPDKVREEHSAFCMLMYLGYQGRFLDRHPGETPEEFLDRPRKTTLNVTKVAVDVLSQLYAQRPKRELDEDEGEIAAALKDIWNDQYDLDLLEADRFTRLEGTVGVRPIYDPESRGKIRLRIFHSFQLRVIPNPVKPWRPLAVIERHEPFMDSSRINVWTRDTFLTVDEEGRVAGEAHGMGRIPITFFRNRKSSPGSFFVEGIGRGLCDKNCVINGKLTDLNEVFSYQGFSVPVVTNYEEDDLVIGPRRPVRFDGVQAGEPFGVEFAQPSAPLTELRQEVEADIVNAFTEQRIPLAALGARIDQRALSGRSIQEAMKPLIDDFQERSRLFTPFDMDLTDNALRVRAENDPGFDYDPEAQRPSYTIDYREPDFPLGIVDQIQLDDFEIAQGRSTPAQQMRRDSPGRFKTEEAAVEQWKRNVEEINSVTRPILLQAEEEEGDATGEILGRPEPTVADVRRAFTPALDALSGLVSRG